MSKQYKALNITTNGQGLYEITKEVQNFVVSQDIELGTCNVFIQHTSASLIIQENADPSAKRDLENWLNMLVKEDLEMYTHTSEGSDDMPAHIKCALTNTSINIPIINSRLALGTWQGIYVWEHRKRGHSRKVLVSYW